MLIGLMLIGKEDHILGSNLDWLHRWGRGTRLRAPDVELGGRDGVCRVVRRRGHFAPRRELPTVYPVSAVLRQWLLYTPRSPAARGSPVTSPSRASCPSRRGRFSRGRSSP